MCESLVSILIALQNRFKKCMRFIFLQNENVLITAINSIFYCKHLNNTNN